MKSNSPIFSLITGYIFNLLVFRIWYYTSDAPIMETVLVVVIVTVLYPVLYSMILIVIPLQTPWKAFLLVVIITLLTLILIKNVYHEKYRLGRSDTVIQANSNKNHSEKKINSAAGNTDLDTKKHEIIFKVQIISSSTRLAKNSPHLKDQKNVWEYKDMGLFKYTVGNQLDLLSASALQSEFQRKGFSGAFVVAFKNGKRIPVGEAKKLLN